MTIDLNSSAAFLTALSAFIVGVGTFFMSFMSWWDGRKIKRAQARLELEGLKREKKIDTLHSAVNGRLSELKIRIAKEAFEMGRKFEKISPDAPSPEMPKPKVEEIMAQLEDAHELARADGLPGAQLP